MGLEYISAVFDWASFVNGRLLETHTAGDNTARTLRSIGADLALSQVMTYDANNSDVNTTPKAVAVLRQRVLIPGGGTYTLDLETAAIEGATLAGVRATTEDLNGKKLLGMVIVTGVITRNAGSVTWAANVGVMTIKPAAAGGYLLFGAAITQGIKLGVRSHFATFDVGDDYPAIVNSGGGSPAHKIEFVGTAADKAEILFLFS